MNRRDFFGASILVGIAAFLKPAPVSIPRVIPQDVWIIDGMWINGKVVTGSLTIEAAKPEFTIKEGKEVYVWFNPQKKQWRIIYAAC